MTREADELASELCQLHRETHIQRVPLLRRAPSAEPDLCALRRTAHAISSLPLQEFVAARNSSLLVTKSLSPAAPSRQR